jgi:sigma-B regulation protein RsbU (phosphoserine phosphatase)
MRILIVEDSPTDADLLARALHDALTTEFTVELVECLHDALARLAGDDIGLIITDLNLPDSFGLVTFQRLTEIAGDIPIVILSGLEDLELAAESVRLGAQDYLVKGTVAVDSLSRIIRFAIERGKRIQAERERDQATHELQIARDIQRSLYPPHGLDLPGFKIAGAAYSADRACGDYHDFFPVSENRYAIVLGDVCGHGLSAALMMMQVRTCLRLLAKQGATPGEVLSGVHDAVLHDDDDQRRFASVFFGQLDLTTSTLTFASAGHRGYILKPDGSTEFLEPTGMVLGIVPDTPMPDVETVALQPGDLLFIPTDGFHETGDLNRQLFGEPRMLDTIHRCRLLEVADIIQNLHTEVRNYAGDAPQHDDSCSKDRLKRSDENELTINQTTRHSPADFHSSHGVTCSRQPGARC